MNVRGFAATLTVTACLVVGSAIPASAATGSGTGNPGSTSGGIIPPSHPPSGNDPPPPPPGPGGHCAGARIMAVYDVNVWNANPGPTKLASSVWPMFQTVGDNHMVFLVDYTTGLVWGPPSLNGYNAALGEGIAPGGSGPFDVNAQLPVYTVSRAFPTYSPGYHCFVGGPPAAVVPTMAGNFGLSTPDGQTATNVPAAALVMDPVTATPSTVCPAASDAPLTGGEYPSPPRVDYNSPPAGCPNSGVWHGTDPSGSWTWVAWETAVPVNATGCSSGSGPYKWDWTPHSYTTPPAYPIDLSAHCTPTPSDSETFYHVTTNSPMQLLAVQLTEQWNYGCTGWAANSITADTWSWSIPGGATFSETKPDGITWAFTCDAGFTQSYTGTTPVPVRQILAIPTS